MPAKSVKKLEKHATVMKHVMPQQHGQLFETETTPEDGIPEESLLLRDDLFEDFGKPKVITVTVTSGDELNATKQPKKR